MKRTFSPKNILLLLAFILSMQAFASFVDNGSKKSNADIDIVFLKRRLVGGNFNDTIAWLFQILAYIFLNVNCVLLHVSSIRNSFIIYNKFI